MLDLKKLLEKILTVDFRYPVGSYYETSDESFDPNITWGGTWEVENPISAIAATATHLSSSGNYNSGTLLTLKKRTKYILLGKGSVSVADQVTTSASFYVSTGTAKVFRNQGVQPCGNSGAMHCFTAYVEVGENDIGVGVNTWDYSSGYTKAWDVIAVPINKNDDTYRWHRTA